MASLYSNENVPRLVVEELRRLGHDVLTSHEAGNANKRVPEQEVVRFARESGRAVLTLNRKDFIQTHAQDSSHLGIIVCRVDVDHAGLAQRIAQALTAHNPLTGKLIQVNRIESLGQKCPGRVVGG